jgi:hypothetical protein
MATAIDIELDDIVDQMAQVILASLCGSCIANTVAMPIVLFPIRYRGDLVWQQCLEAVSDPEGPHFHTDMASMAEFVQYSFNLQHNTSKIVIQ